MCSDATFFCPILLKSHTHESGNSKELEENLFPIIFAAVIACYATSNLLLLLSNKASTKNYEQFLQITYTYY